MNTRTWAAALALCAVAAPSWAINKCITEWGLEGAAFAQSLRVARADGWRW